MKDQSGNLTLCRASAVRAATFSGCCAERSRVSYIAGQRTYEIGIRMALGAGRGRVLRMVLGQAGNLALVGAGFGLVGAISLTRLISSMLFGVSAYDPPTYLAVTALLLLVALAACIVPARRAMRVDPMVALRCDG